MYIFDIMLQKSCWNVDFSRF